MCCGPTPAAALPMPGLSGAQARAARTTGGAPMRAPGSFGCPRLSLPARVPLLYRSSVSSCLRRPGLCCASPARCRPLPLQPGLSFLSLPVRSLFVPSQHRRAPSSPAGPSLARARPPRAPAAATSPSACSLSTPPPAANAATAPRRRSSGGVCVYGGLAPSSHNRAGALSLRGAPVRHPRRRIILAHCAAPFHRRAPPRAPRQHDGSTSRGTVRAPAAHGAPGTAWTRYRRRRPRRGAHAAPPSAIWRDVHGRHVAEGDELQQVPGRVEPSPT